MLVVIAKNLLQSSVQLGSLVTRSLVQGDILQSNFATHLRGSGQLLLTDTITLLGQSKIVDTTTEATHVQDASEKSSENTDKLASNAVSINFMDGIDETTGRGTELFLIKDTTKVLSILEDNVSFFVALAPSIARS